MENTELFGELHEQEENGLLGKQHEKQCFLYSVSNCTHTDLNLKIEPVYDGISTAVSIYKLTDDNGNIWFQGTYEECYNSLYGC